MIIGIAGASASGKTTVAKYLAEKLGGFRTKASDVLIDIAKEKGLPTDKQSLQKLSRHLRKMHGENFLAREVAKRVAAYEGAVVVVEGNRRLTDLRALADMALQRKTKLHLLYVEASPVCRYKRYRQREGASLTYGEFLKLDEDECEQELPAVRDYCAQVGKILETDNLTKKQIRLAAMALLPHIHPSRTLA